MRQNRGKVWLHSSIIRGFIARRSRLSISPGERTQQNHEGGKAGPFRDRFGFDQRSDAEVDFQHQRISP